MTTYSSSDRIDLLNGHGGLSVVDPSTVLRRLWYFDGRFLDAAGFKTDQDYVRALVGLSNRAAGHGIVHGFDVKLDGGTFEVSSGLAINGEGEVIYLPRSADLNIGELIARSAEETQRSSTSVPGEGQFGYCPPDQVQDDEGNIKVSGVARYFVLTAAPVEAACGEEESFGHICSKACAAETDRSYAIEGVLFRVREFRPKLDEFGRNRQIERGAVASSWFADELRRTREPISAARLNNDEWCAGATPSAGREVDLALFERSGEATEWVDIWMVRREISETTPRSYWAGRMNMRPWDIFLAQVLQFQCQLAACTPAIRLDRSAAFFDQIIGGLEQIEADEHWDSHLQPLINEIAEVARKGQVFYQIARPIPGHLLRCIGGELPPCGWLPLVRGWDPYAAAVYWFGAGADLSFRVARPDFIGEVFAEAQHLDRINVAEDEIDVLIPSRSVTSDSGRDDMLEDVEDWIFFVRRRPSHVLIRGVFEDGVDEFERQSLDFINTADSDRMAMVESWDTRVAGDVVAYRDLHGPFLRLDDVQEVSGIGTKRTAALKEHLWARLARDATSAADGPDSETVSEVVETEDHEDR